MDPARDPGHRDRLRGVSAGDCRSFPSEVGLYRVLVEYFARLKSRIPTFGSATALSHVWNRQAGQLFNVLLYRFCPRSAPTLVHAVHTDDTMSMTRI